jgi:hypothetical protein
MGIMERQEGGSGNLVGSKLASMRKEEEEGQMEEAVVVPFDCSALEGMDGPLLIRIVPIGRG